MLDGAGAADPLNTIPKASLTAAAADGAPWAAAGATSMKTCGSSCVPDPFSAAAAAADPSLGLEAERLAHNLQGKPPTTHTDQRDACLGKVSNGPDHGKTSGMHGCQNHLET